jgi:hypothetical protein
MSETQFPRHPRSPHDSRDEIELFLRDAYADGCSAAHNNGALTAAEYAKKEAPFLRAVLTGTITNALTTSSQYQMCDAVTVSKAALDELVAVTRGLVSEVRLVLVGGCHWCSICRGLATSQGVQHTSDCLVARAEKAIEGLGVSDYDSAYRWRGTLHH